MPINTIKGTTHQQAGTQTKASAWAPVPYMINLDTKHNEQVCKVMHKTSNERSKQVSTHTNAAGIDYIRKGNDVHLLQRVWVRAGEGGWGNRTALIDPKTNEFYLTGVYSGSAEGPYKLPASFKIVEAPIVDQTVEKGRKLLNFEASTALLKAAFADPRCLRAMTKAPVIYNVDKKIHAREPVFHAVDLDSRAVERNPDAAKRAIVRALVCPETGTAYLVDGLVKQAVYCTTTVPKGFKIKLAPTAKMQHANGSRADNCGVGGDDSDKSTPSSRQTILNMYTGNPDRSTPESRQRILDMYVGGRPSP